MAFLFEKRLLGAICTAYSAISMYYANHEIGFQTQGLAAGTASQTLKSMQSLSP